MRRAALALLLLVIVGGCGGPSGASVALCDASWRLRDVEIVEGSGGGEDEAIEIECMRPIERRRLRIGIAMPPGPDCYRLSRIDVVESADAVEVTVFVSRLDDAAAGACPDQRQRIRTEIDLQQAVGSRTLLDGSRPADPSRAPSASP